MDAMSISIVRGAGMSKDELIALLTSSSCTREWHTRLLDVCDRYFGGMLPPYWDDVVAEGHLRRFEERAARRPVPA